MSFKAFLLKLVGQHPEQVEEQKRFEENMDGLDAQRQKLDSLLEDIREVDKTVREKSDALQKTDTSMRPEEYERQEPEEPGEDSIRIEGIEEFTP
jgi:peptidoglycan hydrolase CwlO-like protein